MANNSNGNQFRDDEIVVLAENGDGKLVKSIHPKIGGRLRLAHEENQQISITTEVIRYDEDIAVARSVTTTMNGTFPGIGMASVERDYAIAPAILELAETRAIARSLRFATCGLGFRFTCEIYPSGALSFTLRTKGGQLSPRAYKIRVLRRPVSWTLLLDLPSGSTT